MSGSDLNETGWGPYPGQQMKFFTAPEDEVFGGGAGGGGKSMLGMMKYTQQLVVEHQRFRKGEIKRSKAWGFFGRRKTTDLEQMVDESHEYFPNFDSKAKYNANTSTWNFPSCGDAKFQFDHMQHVKDRFRYKSSAFTYVYFDELTEFEKIQYLYMKSRIRSKDPVLSKMLQIVSGSNPDGPGLLWVRDMFIEGKEPERVYRTVHTLEDGRTKEMDSVFIPFRLKDNPALYESGQYELQLRGLPQEIQEAILNGNWYYASGAYLARVWDSKYHVCPNHAVPSGASIFRSMDYGYSKPGSCTWWYLDRDGVLTAFYNLYLTEHTPEMWAQRIREVEEEFDIWDDNNNMSRIAGPLDLSCWDKAHSGTTISRRMWERGVKFYKSKKGPGSRLNSSVEVITRMRARVKDPLFPNDRTKDRPLIRWMERCGAPIRTLPVLRPDPNNMEDVDTDGDDHCFASGTMVKTPSGEMAIERIMAGDLVMTDVGPRHVLMSWMTKRNAPTVRVDFDDGSHLIATAGHKVVRGDGAETKIDHLTVNDTVYAWENEERASGRRISTESGTTNVPTGTGGRISRQSSPGRTPSIGTFGRMLMEPFLQIMRSITMTRTALITRSAISFSRELLTIGVFTESSALPAASWLPISPSLALLHRPGTAQMPDGNSTASSARPMPPGSFQGEQPALSVGLSSRTDPETGRQPCAAGSADRSTSVKRILAIGSDSPRDVYNLHVSERHRYYANGTLVLNCWDETRYMCASKPLVPAKEQDPDEDEVDNVVDIKTSGRVGVGSWASGRKAG